jgi:PKD repeat protein
VLALSFCVGPILADDQAGSAGVFPGYYDISNVFFANANQGAYYFAFDEDGGGINAIHMASTDQAAPNYGDVSTTTSQSGTFYITDTGGRGYQDDAILMIAAKAPIPSNFTIQITSNGYTWIPTGNANDQPTLANVSYHTGVDTTFTPVQFVYGPQTWRPAGKNQPENYPLYYGDDTTDTTNTYYLMFVDLKSGPLGSHGSNINENTVNTLNNHGAVRVDYTLSNLNTVVAFDAYCWNSNTNGGPLTDRGISWSNGLNSQASVPSMISGYTVLGPAYAAYSSEFPTAAGSTPVYKAPDASFTSNATSGTAPLTVQFTDTTLQSVRTWSWDFGDGSNSTLENPAHTFTGAGSFNVKMTVTSPQGMSATATQTITVTSSSGGGSSAGGGGGGGSESSGGISSSGNSSFAGQIGFVANVTTGVAPLAVQFNDTSTFQNISAWDWNITGSAVMENFNQNPVFVFPNIGNYTVNLTVTTLDGSVYNLSQPDYIQATVLPASMGSGWVSSDQYTPPSDESPDPGQQQDPVAPAGTTNPSSQGKGGYSPLGTKVAGILMDCIVVVGVIGAGVIVWKKM